MESRRIVFRETSVVALGEGICIGAMFLVYWLLEKMDNSVLLGGLVGALVATLNFFFMAVMASLAADKAQAQDVAGGKKLMKGSYPVRILLVALVLIVCAKSGRFDVISLLLPLLFVRPIITIAEFFRKKGV